MGKAYERISPRWKYSVKSVAIIGPNGQLGTDLSKIFRGAGWEVKPISHQKIQIEDINSVKAALTANKSDWVINTAAFHNVNKCEEDSEKAWLINSLGQFNVALIAKELKMKSAFISSDYVFSGEKPGGSHYEETDLVSPVNVYGHSKASGESATLMADPHNLVIRIASIFGAVGSSDKGGNFVETILKKAHVGEALSVVNDITMSPTYTVDASNRILTALDNSLSGVIHASNAGSATWFEFATEILRISGVSTELTATATNSEHAPRRPKNSALSTKILDDFSNESFSWKDGLRRYLVEKEYIS